MEKQTQQNEVLTKAIPEQKLPQGAFLSLADAEEFRAYKRRKKISEVNAAIARSQSSVLGGEDIQRVCDRALRLKQAAVKVPLTKLSQAAYYLTDKGVKLDCNIGGNGETLTKVKVYETRLAVKRKAGEITLPVTPSYLDACRYGEIRREIKRVKRAAKKAGLKVRVEKTYSPTALSRVARIACEAGAKYFSVPYFEGCLRLKMEMIKGCQLEVTGVQSTAEFKKLTEAGVGRIVSERAWEIYSELLKEANELPAPPPETSKPPEQQAEEKKATLSPPTLPKLAPPLTTSPTAGIVKNPETDYCCRLEGKDLKFL